MTPKDQECSDFFDGLSEEYETTVRQGTGVVAGNDDYLCRYKVEIAKEICPDAAKIMDFGAGIGLSQKYLHEQFPKSTYFATDTSKQSLNLLKKRYPNVTVKETQKVFNEDLNTYDLIFVSCVFHHIEPKSRGQVLCSLVKCLKHQGSLIIFEHNPYNPLTQLVVKTSPIDKGVKLLKMSELLQMGNQLENVSCNGAYTVFFPSFMKKLRKLEKSKLKHVKLGAQYYVHLQNLG